MGHGTIVGGEVDLLGEAIEDTEGESGNSLYPFAVDFCN